LLPNTGKTASQYFSQAEQPGVLQAV